MPDDRIPDDLRRFILTSIDSVPHIEALLLFHRNQKVEWNASEAAQRLFVRYSRVETKGNTRRRKCLSRI